MSESMLPLRRRVPAGDAELDVVDWGGEGSAVLLAHAHTGQAKQLGLLAEILRAGGLRVLAYDRRGYGKSSRGSDYGTSRQGEDACAVLDAMGIETVHACGMAAGGGTMLDLAFLYPGRVRSIAVVCSFMGRHAGEWAGPGHAVPSVDEDPVALEVSSSFAARHPEVVRAWSEVVAEARASGAGQPAQPFAMAALERADFVGWGKEFNDRLLVISGGEDRLFTPRMAESARRFWPQARHETLASTAHVPSLECPGELAKVLTSHICRSKS